MHRVHGIASSAPRQGSRQQRSPRPVMLRTDDACGGTSGRTNPAWRVSYATDFAANVCYASGACGLRYSPRISSTPLSLSPLLLASENVGSLAPFAPAPLLSHTPLKHSPDPGVLFRCDPPETLGSVFSGSSTVKRTPRATPRSGPSTPSAPSTGNSVWSRPPRYVHAADFPADSLHQAAFSLPPGPSSQFSVCLPVRTMSKLVGTEGRPRPPELNCALWLPALPDR